MGVHGLWRLLDSFGQVARPEDWAGRRVAIDASIWIAQFRAKTEIGEDVERRVLVGFFARILKLLFYNIEAVFVFDGPATTLKTAEQRRRGQRREAVAQAFLRRRARQIMMAQIAAGVLDVSALPQQRKRANKNKHSELPAETDKSGGEEEEEGSDDENEEDEVGEDNDGDEEGESNSDEDDVASSSSSSNDSSSQQQQQEQQTATSHTDTPEHAETHDGDHTATQQVTKRRRHRHHRRALAPAKVSAALTANFLDRAREQLSEYEKGEQRLMYNLLRHSSTSLFMGPRRVIVEENGGQPESTHDVSATSASAPPHKKAKQEPASSAVVDVDSVSEVSEGSEDAEVQLVHTSSAKAAKQHNSSADTTKDKAGVSVASPSTTPAATATALSGLVPAQVVHALYQRPQHTPSPSRTNNNTTISLTSPIVKAAARVATKKRAASSTSPSPSQPHNKGGEVGSQTVDLVTQDSAKAAHSVSSSSSSSLSWASVGEDELKQGDALAHDNHDLRLTGSSVERGMTGDAEDDVFDSEEEEEEDERNGELLWAPGTQGLPLPRESRSPSREPAAPAQQHSPLDSTHVAAAGHVKVCDASDAKVGVMKADDEEDYTPVKGFAPTSLVLAGTTITSSSPQPSAPASASSSAAVQAPNFFASVVHHGEAARRATVLPPELTDIVLLLESCGLSYVVSPAESDAQCAFLARHGLVDAVFTEDSDVVVHGSPVVLRGFFSTAQQVVEYRQSELAACGMDKRVLVALAMLLGCDYVEGVPGMGLVSALDAIAVGWDAKEDTAKTRKVGEGNDDDVLQAEVDAVWRVLTRWRTLVTQPPRTWLDADDALTLQQFQLLDHYRLHWAAPALRPSFPERRVIEAFYTAAVDDDKRPFPPLVVEWNRLRLFAGSRGLFADGWLAQRFELARRECERRAAAAAAAKATADPTQRKLTDYGIGHQVRERWAFKKLHVTYANALSHLRAARHMTVIEDTPTKPGNEEEEVAVVKTTRKQKAPVAKRTATRRKAAPRKTK